AGAAYVAGVTLSGDFPTTPGAFQTTIGGGACSGDDACADGFVTKLRPDGAALAYATFLGGAGSDAASRVAVDAPGHAYVWGQTNAPDFPLQNAVQPVWGGGGCNTGSSYYPCYDAFVTKLRPDGAALVYSTYLGGDRDEAYYYVEHGGLAIDAAGHAYVT